MRSKVGRASATRREAIVRSLVSTPPAPLVSVLLAVKDGERFLRSAVTSVLRQSVDDLELIVVDDGSSDGTQAILEELDDPRLVVVRNDEPQGLARSLNTALDRARGSYVARLDADDVALPDRLERQLAHLRANPGLAVVGSAVLEVDEGDRVGSLHVMPSGSCRSPFRDALQLALLPPDGARRPRCSG